MTLSLLHFPFLEYTLPPLPSKADKSPPSAEDESTPAKADRPLPPEARWLLWQWSRVIGLEQSTACHVRTLCQRLGMTPQQWSRLMGMLKTSGVMVTCPLPQERGRPLSEHRITAQLRYDLARLTLPDTYHDREIERVLDEGALPPAAEAKPQVDGRAANLLPGDARQRRLTLANRWLIAVLLAHAETPGRVTGLSYTRLERLTGMRRHRLLNQLRKLHAHEILVHHPPGRSGRVLGGRMTSIFTLNLRHPLFGLDDRMAFNILLSSPSRKGLQHRSVINGLVEALFVAATAHTEAATPAGREARRDDWRKVGSVAAARDWEAVQAAEALLPKTFDPTPLASRLASAYDTHAASWLQVRVQGYAMQLLSNGWHSLREGQGGPDDPVDSVMEAIASDFPESPDAADQKESQHERTEAAREDEHDDADRPNAKLLYALAHHLAVELQAIVSRVMRLPDDDCLGNLSVCLTPVDWEGRPFWALIGYLRLGHVETPPRPGFYVIEPIKSDLSAWLQRRPLVGDTPVGHVNGQDVGFDSPLGSPLRRP